MNEGEVYTEVQAALLNSECSPSYAVERAIDAVVEFAWTDSELSEIQIIDMVRAAWARERDK